MKLRETIRDEVSTEWVTVVDDHDAVHAAVELWCTQAQPPIRFAGGYFSAEQFVAEHAASAVRGIGVVVLGLDVEGRVDFAGLDLCVQQRHRVIVYSHFSSDKVILTALDRGAVTYLAKSERKDHLIDAIRAAGTDTPMSRRRWPAPCSTTAPSAGRIWQSARRKC